MNFLILPLLNLVNVFADEKYVIVSTKCGELKGQVERSRGGRLYSAFYGIPYAEPPVGDLRFENPVPAKSWGGVRDATRLPPPCLHINDRNGKIFGEEDCLYLNLYTPELTGNTLLPVMVHIYGSRFILGHALPSTFGPQYFMDEDVIVITFHYRLGALGFLSTGNNVLPGNYGLKDFVAVLNWVQENARAFGGDKSRVTVVGNSSGGVTAALALMSPLTKGLFHRSISQSGYPFSVIQPEEARERAWKFALHVGCSPGLDDEVNASKYLVTCLKKLPARRIAKENLSVKNVGNLSILPFEPVIEDETVPGAFLVDDPRKLLSRNSNIPWMLGLSSADGGFLAIMAYYNSFSRYAEELATHYDSYFAYFSTMSGLTERRMNSSQRWKISETLKEYFFGVGDISTNAQGFSKMITTLRYLPGIKKSVELYRGPLYIYCYDHTNEEASSHARRYGKPEEDFGVIHGSELISLWNISEHITPVTKGVDLVVSHQMLKLWTNFAAFGDPNGNGETLWKPVESTKVEHLVIKNGVLEMKDEFRKEEYEFLEKLWSLEEL